MDTMIRPYLNIGPGEFIKEELEIRNWKQDDLSDILGISTKTVNEIINGKQSITIETARLLSRAFGQSPQYWINLDANYHLRLNQNESKAAEVERKAYIYKYLPIREMIKKGWIREYKNTDDLVKEVKRFWQIDTLDLSFLDRAVLPIFRKSDAFGSYNGYYAQIWFQMAKKCAGRYSVPKYNREKLSEISASLPSYTMSEPGILRFFQDIESAGIKFFVLSHLPKTYIDGAAFHDNENPVIVYTNRYDRMDNFWFTIAHEISHVLRHLNGEDDYIIDAGDEPQTEIEYEANHDAEIMLKRDGILEFFANNKLPVTKAKVITCSTILHIGEAIIVGLMQHRNLLSRRNLNNFRPSVSNCIPLSLWPEKTLYQ